MRLPDVCGAGDGASYVLKNDGGLIRISLKALSGCAAGAQAITDITPQTFMTAFGSVSVYSAVSYTVKMTIAGQRMIYTSLAITPISGGMGLVRP